jgi:Mn2+/Fe2+ NRAMP family transporter
MSGTGLAMHALFPVLGVKAWGVISGFIGLALVWSGRYGLFEKVLSAMVLMMFVSMVTAAALTLPNLPELLTGLVPTIPDDAILNVLSVTGGVGGTITLAAYGYWLREKGWSTPRYMRVMRLDNSVAYAVTGLFVIATLIVGAELLYSAKIAVATGDKGMLDLSNVLEDRYGSAAGTVFLVGFFAAAMSSLVGVWNGVSLMFADFVGHIRGHDADHPDSRAGGKYYKAYVVWLTVPPIVLIFLGQPVGLILAYGVLGAFFMPFLSVTLLWILNTDRVPREWRNKLPSNIGLVVCTLAFGALAVNEIVKAIKLL